MKPWSEMTKHERMRAEYSDLHKDVVGMRPTLEHYIEVSQWSDEELEREFDRLVELLPGD